jgi:hypothetical protein
VADPLRLLGGVGDRYRTSGRDPEQREPLERGRVHYRRQVRDLSFERDLARAPIRQTAPSAVVANERVTSTELREPVAPDGASPVVLEVREPVGHLDDRRPLAVESVGEADAVLRAAEADLLLHGEATVPVRPRSPAAPPSPSGCDSDDPGCPYERRYSAPLRSKKLNEDEPDGLGVVGLRGACP